MDIDQFDFSLPANLIARYRANPPNSAKLLHVPAHNASFGDSTIANLADFFEAGELIIYNDCKVLPARIGAYHQPSSKIMLTFIERIDANQAGQDHWRILAKPARKIKENLPLTLDGGLQIMPLSKAEDGSVEISVPMAEYDFYAYLEAHGAMPLPPYIESARKQHGEPVSAKQDKDDYQTIFAAKQGGVAAPTAGLHIDEALRDALIAKNVRLMPVTLLVGAGTFLPVKVQNIEHHKMHQEWGEVPSDTAAAIQAQIKAKGKITALGTTSLRIIEAAAQSPQGFGAFKGKTDIFITPGFEFSIIDRLMTNFHLPKSTLFMLVSAFSGLDRMQAAYRHAVAHDYRFFSYGDACLLERSK
ncbi:MAG: tRNA preQ1(34) S-adenosylmethionine ribosyltransferase-isomerase QueA [Alphaproteobacteria bacterium]